MNYFLKHNKNLLTYSLIFLLLVPIFGLNFIVSFLGNILLLLFLIPLLLLIITFISFNSLKSKFNKCSKCGAVSLGLNNVCLSCGSNFENVNINDNELISKPSERTIEIKAEEIK